MQPALSSRSVPDDAANAFKSRPPVHADKLVWSMLPGWQPPACPNSAIILPSNPAQQPLTHHQLISLVHIIIIIIYWHQRCTTKST